MDELTQAFYNWFCNCAWLSDAFQHYHDNTEIEDRNNEDLAEAIHNVICFYCNISDYENEFLEMALRKVDYNKIREYFYGQ